jgi:hypothetical protein
MRAFRSGIWDRGFGIATKDRCSARGIREQVLGLGCKVSGIRITVEKHSILGIYSEDYLLPVEINQ